MFYFSKTKIILIKKHVSAVNFCFCWVVLKDNMAVMRYTAWVSDRSQTIHKQQYNTLLCTVALTLWTNYLKLGQELLYKPWSLYQYIKNGRERVYMLKSVFICSNLKNFQHSTQSKIQIEKKNPIIYYTGVFQLMFECISFTRNNLYTVQIWCEATLLMPDWINRGWIKMWDYKGVGMVSYVHDLILQLHASRWEVIS